MIVRGYLPHEWDAAKGWLRKIADHGNEWFTYDNLKDDVRGLRRQLWFFDQGGNVLGAGLTSVIGNGRIVYIDAVHGKKREAWAAAFDAAVERWARGLGAREIRTRARKGWAREAAELGWRETHREYRRRVT